MGTAGPITCYQAMGGVHIYRIPVSVFPMLTANVYIVMVGEYRALIDTGSGLGACDEQLNAGVAALRTDWGEEFDWADLKRIVVTHGHIDHYGGVGALRARTDAPIAVHELDRRVLTHYEERLVLTSRALSAFLRRAGVSETQHMELMKMHGWGKGLFRSVEVTTTLHHGDLLDGVFRVSHVPGHCPGQICLQIADILFTADHVLPRTSPHLAPESITPSTGLGHYLQALETIAVVPNIRLALGGHEEPIEDVYARIAAIKVSHERKLQRLRDACAEPHTISELTTMIYPNVQGYDTLLAIEEIGAQVEHLDQRGELSIANLDAVAEDEATAPRYQHV